MRCFGVGAMWGRRWAATMSLEKLRVDAQSVTAALQHALRSSQHHASHGKQKKQKKNKKKTKKKKQKKKKKFFF